MMEMFCISKRTSLMLQMLKYNQRVLQFWPQPLPLSSHSRCKFKQLGQDEQQPGANDINNLQLYFTAVAK
jgi:hypothetical protein